MSNFVTEKSCYDTQRSMAEKIDEVKEKINELDVKLAGLPKALVDEMDKRYASKETEIMVKRVQWMVIAAVIAAVLALVFKP